MRVERVAAQIERDFRSEHLALAQRFVRQPSISNEGIGMEEMAALVAATIRDLGGSAEVCPTAGWPVVYGRIDAGAPKTLLLYGMYDVQPAEEEDWIVPPFAGEIVARGDLGECLVSRGATNSKGPLAAFCNTIASIRAAGEPLPVNIIFLIEGEEEMGSSHLPAFVASRAGELRQADFAYFPAFRQPVLGPPIMQLGTKGLLYLEISCQGGEWGGPRSRGVHGAYAAWFASPAWSLIQALATMTHGDQITVADFFDDVVPPTPGDERAMARHAASFDFGEALAENDVARFRYDLPPHDLLRQYLFQPTLNIDGISGGYVGEGNKTLLPYRVAAKVDVRMVPNMDAATTVERLRAHLDRHGFAHVKLEVLGAYPWSKVDPDHPLARTAAEAFHRRGLDPLVWPLNPGSAPLYLFYETLGIPYVVCGPGHGERAHSSNELCTVDGLLALEHWTAVFLDLLAMTEGGTEGR
jgi:acetylornithine deacetylase/succinyl-diaminopimelate desuccinylase-like protein